MNTHNEHNAWDLVNEVPETRNPDERIRQRYLEILFMQPIEPKPGMFSFSDNGRTLNGMRFLRKKHYA